MKKILLLSLGALFGLFLAGCTSSEEQSEDNTSEAIRLTGVNLPFTDEDGMRCYIDENTRNRIWEVGDVIGVFATSGPNMSQMKYVAEDVDVAEKTAIFNPGSYWFKPSFEFVAYYPLKRTYLEYDSDIDFSLSGQTQRNNNDASALTPFMFNRTKNATSPDETGKTLNFTFSSFWALVYTDFTMPKAGTWTKFTLHAPEGCYFHENINYNFAKEGGAGITNADSKTSITLTLGEDGNGITLGKDDHLQLFMYVCPTEMTGKDLVVDVQEKDGTVYSCTISGKNGLEDRPFFQSNNKYKLAGSPESPEDAFDITGTGSDFNKKSTN